MIGAYTDELANERISVIKMVCAMVKLRWLLVDAAVDPAEGAKKRSREGELVGFEARQFGGF